MINSNNFLGYKKLHVPSQYDASNPTERSRSVLVIRSVGGNDIIVAVPRPHFEPQDWLPNLQIPGQFPIPKKNISSEVKLKIVEALLTIRNNPKVGLRVFIKITMSHIALLNYTPKAV